jgi:hypothetical protein
MKDRQHLTGEIAAADDLHRIVSTSVTIFDSAFALLSEQSPGGVTIAGRGYLECMKNVLNCLGIGEEEEDFDGEMFWGRDQPPQA